MQCDEWHPSNVCFEQQSILLEALKASLVFHWVGSRKHVATSCPMDEVSRILATLQDFQELHDEQ